MKKIAVLVCLAGLSIGCASRPIKCRIVALDNQHKIRKDVPPSRWHPANECAAEGENLKFLPPGRFGLEVRGGKKSIKQFYDFMMRPNFPSGVPELVTTSAFNG
jgi:hypothetical protein